MTDEEKRKRWLRNALLGSLLGGGLAGGAGLIAQGLPQPAGPKPDDATLLEQAFGNVPPGADLNTGQAYMLSPESLENTPFNSLASSVRPVLDSIPGLGMTPPGSNVDSLPTTGAHAPIDPVAMGGGAAGGAMLGHLVDRARSSSSYMNELPSRMRDAMHANGSLWSSMMGGGQQPTSQMSLPGTAGSRPVPELIRPQDIADYTRSQRVGNFWRALTNRQPIVPDVQITNRMVPGTNTPAPGPRQQLEIPRQLWQDMQRHAGGGAAPELPHTAGGGGGGGGGGGRGRTLFPERGRVTPLSGRQTPRRVAGTIGGGILGALLPGIVSSTSQQRPDLTQ